jgi:hypothetical protein
MTVIGKASARRAFGVLALALAAAGTAAVASASAWVPRPGVPAPAGGAAAALNQMRFGVRLVDVPVLEVHNRRALQYIIDQLPTGSVIHRRVMIVNKEHKTANFSVYPGAAQISNGEFTGLDGAAVNELTGWITVQHPTVRLGPGKSTMDRVTIRVPKGATRGEHYGVIWTQQTAPAKGSHGIAVGVVARVGVRIYLAVGRGGLAPTKFAIMSITAQRHTPDHPMLIVHVDNIGGRAVDLSSKLKLTKGPGGATAGPVNGQRVVTLAPGQSGNVTFALPATLPAGPWLATVTLQSGFDVATAHATVLFAVPRTTSWINAATLAGGAALLALISIATVMGVRARRARQALA